MKIKYFFFAFLLVVSTSCKLHAQQKRLFIANDDHTDYMWTANEAKYDSAFVHMLDYYLRQIDSTKNFPSNFQTRFNCDGSLWLKAYQKYRSTAQFNKLIAAIKSGHISSPLNMLVNCYGAQPTEAVIRGMYYAGQQERLHGIRFPMAVAMENQTLPLGLSSLWAGAGAIYSWRGVCGCATKMGRHWAHRRHQLYRYTGLDNSGVIMKWYNMPIENYSLGGYGETRMVQHPQKNLLANFIRTIDTLSAMCNSTTYPYNTAAAFGYGWDDFQTFVSPQFIEAARQGTNTNRTVRVSNEIDFFEDVEKNHPALPVESVSYGNEWDTYCASMNETTAKVRRATEKLRTAEAFYSIVALNNKNFGKSLVAARNLAWEGLGVYWEHDWTADGPVKQNLRADWQIKIQNNISNYTNALLSESITALGKQIKKANNPRFFVFNALSWSRNDIADIAYTGSYPVKVIDMSTGVEAESQLIKKNGLPFLRVNVKNIPSVGYKVFEIREGVPGKIEKTIHADGEYISNQFYKIRVLKSGVITEIIDKAANNKNIVTVIDGKYLNDLGTSNINEGEPLVIENEGPVSVTLKAISTQPILLTVRITLFKDNPRIEIEDSIQANFKKLNTWAFSFNLKNQTTRHEELGAILTAKLENRGGHYATQNARYDWLTFNHFVNLSEANYGITLSNQDCSFFKLGKSTPDSLWENSTQINALAGGQTDAINDSTYLGISAQYGQQQFQYNFALCTHAQKFDAAQAMKFSLEHQNPLVTGMITGEENILPQRIYSLLNINNPNVLLWAVKPSEEGIDNGLITRVWNFSSKPVAPVVQFSKPIRSVWQTTHLETNEKILKFLNNSLKTDFKQYQLKTYRIVLK